MPSSLYPDSNECGSRLCKLLMTLQGFWNVQTMALISEEQEQGTNAYWEQHLSKPRVLSPLRFLRVRNEVDLVPLACEDGGTGNI